MHYRFFGDSWYWTWSYQHNGIKSKEIQKLYHSGLFGDPEVVSDCISIIEILLKHLGHTVETFCQPGRCFEETVQSIKDAPVDTDAVNIVFYSSDLRGFELDDFFVANGHLSFDENISKLDHITLDNLNTLGEYALNTDQTFLLAGGQSTLYKDVYRKCSYTANLALISECIISDLQDITAKRRFKLCDAGPGARYEKYNHMIVNMIHDDIEQFTGESRVINWPDHFHLNGTSTIYFMDLIFQHLEAQDNTA